MRSTQHIQNTVLFLPFAVYFVRFDEVFVGKKGHRSVREAYAKLGSLIADFRTPFVCVFKGSALIGRPRLAQR